MDEKQLAELLPDFYKEEDGTDGMRIISNNPYDLALSIEYDKENLFPEQPNPF